MLHSSRPLALASGCIAALGWALTGTFVKLLPHFTTLEVLSIRLLVAFFVAIPLFLIYRPLLSEFLALVRTPIGILLSGLMVLYYLFAVRAFQLAPVSDVVLMVGLSPLIGLVVKAILRKPVAILEGIGASTAFVGLVLFVLPKLQGNSAHRSTYLTGLFLAFLAACITLGYASLFKHYAGINTSLNPVAVGFTTFSIGSLLIAPFVMLSSPQIILHLAQPNSLGIALGLGILSTVIPTLCYSYAAKHLSPVLTTALNLLTPIFAALLAFLLLREQLPVWSLIGAILIIIGILMLSIPQPKNISKKIVRRHDS